jgi:CubicO group peptidase (beta-lactamase class C family)
LWQVFANAQLPHNLQDGNDHKSRNYISLLTEAAPVDGHGLGWFVGKSDSPRYLEHAGCGSGFATMMRLYPEAGLGIAILGNGTDLDRDGLMDLLAQLAW